MRRVSVLFILATAAVSSADTVVFPHVLEKEGKFVGNLFNVTGGYRLFGNDPTTGPSFVPFEFIPSVSPAVLAEVLPLSSAAGLHVRRGHWNVKVQTGARTASNQVQVPFLEIDEVMFGAAGPPKLIRELEFLRVRVTPQVVIILPPPPTPLALPRKEEEPFAMGTPEVMINGHVVQDASTQAFGVRVATGDVDGDGVPERSYAQGHFALDCPRSSLNLQIGEPVELQVTYNPLAKTPGFGGIIAAVVIVARGTVVGSQPRDLFAPLQGSTGSGTSMHWVLEVRVDRIEMK